jgi:methyl-accepting chemotaxis protein
MTQSWINKSLCVPLILLCIGTMALSRTGLGNISLSLLVVVMVLLTAMWLTRQQRQALRPAAQVAVAIAAGHLGQRHSAVRRDEFGFLHRALLTMDGKLDDIVSTVRVRAVAVARTARELAMSSERLNDRTQTQASALQRTAASVEQLAATVQQNADRALQARLLSTEVSRQAEASNEQVREAIAAMGQIKEASTQIAEIIGVIDEIAFQTNLLALNAAVEAARAGEQGRSFAVVAEEVRALAQRTAQAAKQVKMLITESGERIHTGAELVESSGATLFAITGKVGQVTGIVVDIAGASHEQAAGVTQISDAMSHLDAATQENASLVEETANASKVMEQQAGELIKQIGFFRRAWDDEQMPAASLIGEILIYQRENARLAMNAAIARSADAVEAARISFEHNRDRISELWPRYRHSAKARDELQLAEQYWGLRIEYIATIEEVFRLLKSGAHDQAQQLVMRKLSDVSNPMFELGDRLRRFLEQQDRAVDVTGLRPQASSAA